MGGGGSDKTLGEGGKCVHLEEGHTGSLKDELAARKDKASGLIAPILKGHFEEKGSNVMCRKLKRRVLLCENTLENNSVLSGSKTLNFSRVSGQKLVTEL